MSPESTASDSTLGTGWKWDSMAGRPAGKVGWITDRACALASRIQDRVEQMYADGLLDEAALLPAPNLSSTARQAIGYVEAIFLQVNTRKLR